MLPKQACVAPFFRLIGGISPLGRLPRSRRLRPGLRPFPERLESRVVLDGSIATYTWTALGDGSSFSDPKNWSHVGPLGGGVGVPGVPAPGSNLAFPPISWLPANSPTTINFNVNYGSLPYNLFQIGDSYTFTGDAVAVGGGIIVTNPQFGKATSSTILLSGVSLGKQATIYTQQSSTLTIGTTTNPTGVPLTLQGGAIKSGGGLLVLNTRSITDPQFGFTLQTFEVAGGTATLGTSMDFSNSLFRVDPGVVLNVADNAAVKVGSLSGPGTVDLEGTGAAGDLTSLTAFTPVGESDQLTGSVVGVGQFAMQGHGSLTLGGINFGGAGTVDVVLGTLDVDGPINAGTLLASGGTFGGVGSWKLNGPVTFQAG